MEVHKEENVKAIIIIVLAPKKLDIQIQGDLFIVRSNIEFVL